MKDAAAVGRGGGDARSDAWVIGSTLLRVGLALGAAALAAPGATWTAPLLAAPVAAGAGLWAGGRWARGRTLGLWVERTLPTALTTGRWVDIHLRFHWGGARPLDLEFADRPPDGWALDGADGRIHIEPGGSGAWTYRARPATRGRATFGRLGLRLRTHGWWDEDAWADLLQEVAVGPDDTAIRAALGKARRDLLGADGRRTVTMPGRDGEFDRLRAYVPGDDLRHIDWKATARAREPMVRQHEAERSQCLYILLDATRWMGARTGDRTLFDHGVEAALALARAAVDAGDRVGLCVFDERTRLRVPPRQGAAQLARIREAIAFEQPTRGFPRYAAAATTVAADLRRRSLLVWLTDLADAQQGGELLSALRVLRGRHLSVVVCLDSGDLDAVARSPVHDEASLHHAAAAVDLLDERDARIARLRREGARVAVARPEAVAQVAVARYAEVKRGARL